MLRHASNSTKWSPLSCNKNQLVAPLLVCARERGFLKGYSEGSSVFKRLWASRKLLSFKNTSPLWVLIQLKWRQFLTCIIYAMYSHQAIFMQSKQFQHFPSVEEDDFFPHFPELSICRAVTKGKKFCILSHRISASEMCFTEDFLAWLAKEQKGLFRLLYTSFLLVHLYYSSLLCIAASGQKSPMYNFKISFLAWHQREVT